MDPITHTCSGILIGQGLCPPPGVRRQTLLVSGLAAFAPDVDAVSYLWGSEAFYRFHHTYTHTVLGITALVITLAGIERIWIKQIPLTRLLALNLAGCTMHLLGDLIAIWPLRILWPWSDHDFTLHWTRDSDWVVLTVVVLATGLAETDGFQKQVRWIIVGAFLILAAYFWWFPGWAGL